MLILSDNKIKDLNITCLENEMRRNDIEFLSTNVNSASFLFLWDLKSIKIDKFRRFSDNEKWFSNSVKFIKIHLDVLKYAFNIFFFQFGDLVGCPWDLAMCRFKLKVPFISDPHIEHLFIGLWIFPFFKILSRWTGKRFKDKVALGVFVKISRI